MVVSLALMNGEVGRDRGEEEDSDSRRAAAVLDREEKVFEFQIILRLSVNFKINNVVKAKIHDMCTTCTCGHTYM